MFSVVLVVGNITDDDGTFNQLLNNKTFVKTKLTFQSQLKTDLLIIIINATAIINESLSFVINKHYIPVDGVKHAIFILLRRREIGIT